MSRHHKAFAYKFCNTEIANLGLEISIEQNVVALDVSMHVGGNGIIMKIVDPIFHIQGDV
jgi:hypothetical protein